MANFNRVTLAGNITRGPDLRRTPQGVAVCGFSLAINRTFRDETGERHEVTFVDCDAWGRAAESIGKTGAVGKSMLVDGRLKFEQWPDPDHPGANRSRLKVVVETFQFLGARQDAEGPQPNTHKKPADARRSEDQSIDAPHRF